MSDNKTVCVVAAPNYQATQSYAEAVAATYGFDIYAVEHVVNLSLTRYQYFLLADDPDSLVGGYLCHQYPNRVSGLAASCDGKLVSRQLGALKKGQLANIFVPSETDAEGLQISTPNVQWLPVDPPAVYPLVLYGLSLQDPNWLKTITVLAKAEIPFALVPESDDEILETLSRFPVNFTILRPGNDDRAFLQSRVVLYGPHVGGDTGVIRSRAFGKKTISTAELADDKDPLNMLKTLVERDPNRATSLYKILSDAVTEDTPRKVFLRSGQGLEEHRHSRLLIKFPTRGRPKKFYPVLEQYIRLLSHRNEVKFLISIDHDDDKMKEEDIRQAVSELQQEIGFRRLEVDVRTGASTGKVNAINRDMEDIGTFDVLLLASDDMVPIQPGYDDVILQAMEKYYPDTDGVLWFSDGYVERRLNTLVCMGLKYYQRFGFIYNDAYTSLWSDNEFMRVANRLGRQVYMDWTIIKHQHPANTGEAQTDALYDKNDKWYQHDHAIFERRQKDHFGVPHPRVLLSILMPTLTNRRDMRYALVQKIRAQAEAISAESCIEIVVDEDRGERSIGTKRTDLVKRAKGEYVMFLDDDDDVADTYVETILANLSSGVPDCVSFAGLLIKKEGVGKMFVHSLRYQSYSEDNRLYYRPPNHLNAVRKTIAERFPFPDKSFSEDTDFCMQMVQAGALKSENFIPLPLYLYRPTEQGATQIQGSLQQKQRNVTMYRTGPVVKPDTTGQRKSGSRNRRSRRR